MAESTREIPAFQPSDVRNTLSCLELAHPGPLHNRIPCVVDRAAFPVGKECTNQARELGLIRPQLIHALQLSCEIQAGELWNSFADALPLKLWQYIGARLQTCTHAHGHSFCHPVPPLHMISTPENLWFRNAMAVIILSANPFQYGKSRSVNQNGFVPAPSGHGKHSAGQFSSSLRIAELLNGCEFMDYRLEDPFISE